MSTIVASSNSAADVQTAIGLALPGDTISVPAGAVTWDSAGVTCNKGIIIDFSGVSVTRGTGTTTLVAVTTHSTDRFRLTGGTFEQTVGNVGGVYPKQFTVNGSAFTNAKFRVDNCTFRSTASSAQLIAVYKAWGLIDNCTITGDDASELIHNEAWGSGVTTGWSDDVVPGSGDALYIEDCVISKYDQTDPYFWGTSALQSYYGSRTVIRYCTLNYCQIDQHGTPGSVGARWWEIYNNNFTIPAGGGNQSNYMDLRAGSGVMFGNTKSGGTNAGSGTIALREEDAGGYPELYQIGRGKDQALDPAYCWDNFKLPSGQATYVIDGRDYYSNTEKPGYTPYEYPHPLQGFPSPPSDLSATADGSSSIDLVWTDNSSDETGFKIERSVDGVTFAQIATVGAGVTSYADVGLAGGVTYHYRVRAYNDSGNSAYSNTANDTTEAEPILRAGGQNVALAAYI